MKQLFAHLASGCSCMCIYVGTLVSSAGAGVGAGVSSAPSVYVDRSADTFPHTPRTDRHMWRRVHRPVHARHMTGPVEITRCMTARDRLRAWNVQFFGSSNLTHKSCGIFVASWGFAHCIGTRLVFHNFFYFNVGRTNGAMQKTHQVLKMRLLIFTLAAFIRGSLEPQRLLIQIWRSSVTDACA